jgi:hypothetical protein
MTADETHEDFAYPGEVLKIGDVEVIVPMSDVFDALGKACSLCDDGHTPCTCGLVIE